MKYNWRYNPIKELLKNEQIRVREVRLVGENGEPLGIMPLSDAQNMAYDKELDLVLISPQANPPVCKIMDYGKYRFNTLKKEKEAKKKQKVVETKGMQLSWAIAEGDIQVKAKNVRRMLDDGNKVKVTLKMHGRQLANTDQGMQVVRHFAEILSDVADVTSAPELTGRIISMVLSPKK